MAKNQRITARQSSFADYVAAGMTLSDSYRQAYTTENMVPSTIHVNACTLATNEKVIRRIDEIQAKKDKQKGIIQLSNRVRVLNKLNELMTDETAPKAVQLNAAVWLGKTDALFTDVQETKDTTPDLDTIDKEIMDRIKELSAQA